MRIDFSLVKRPKVVGPFLMSLAVLGVLYGSPAHAQFALVPIQSNLKLVSFDHYHDGYNVTFRNESPRALVDFNIVIDGRDAANVSIYRRDILVDFLEGYGERTFFVPGYDRSIFEVKFQVVALGYQYSIY